MSTPRRIHRQRTKGWRMPENTVFVGRPTKWGNPYRVVEVDLLGQYPYGWRVTGETAYGFQGYVYAHKVDATLRAVGLFRREVNRQSWADRISELAGKNLACWCPLDQPCHADVLLAMANTEPCPS